MKSEKWFFASGKIGTRMTRNVPIFTDLFSVLHLLTQKVDTDDTDPPLVESRITTDFNGTQMTRIMLNFENL